MLASLLVAATLTLNLGPSAGRLERRSLSTQMGVGARLATEGRRFDLFARLHLVGINTDCRTGLHESAPNCESSTALTAGLRYHPLAWLGLSAEAGAGYMSAASVTTGFDTVLFVREQVAPVAGLSADARLRLTQAFSLELEAGAAAWLWMPATRSSPGPDHAELLSVRVLAGLVTEF